MHELTTNMQCCKENCGDHRADSGILTKQRHGNCVEAGRLRPIDVGQAVAKAGDHDGSRQPGEGTGDQHRHDDRARYTNTGVACGACTLSYRAEFIAEHRALE